MIVKKENNDKKLMRERWQLAAKQAWKNLPEEKKAEYREILKKDQELIKQKESAKKTRKPS